MSNRSSISTPRSLRFSKKYKLPKSVWKAGRSKFVFCYIEEERVAKNIAIKTKEFVESLAKK